MAVSHLIREGYRIEAINYRCPLVEIDIVARDRGVLTFVEVKTRKSELYGSAMEAVDYRKQKRLNRIALYYLGSFSKAEGQENCRFDVVSVTYSLNEGCVVELIKDAFPFFEENF